MCILVYDRRNPYIPIQAWFHWWGPWALGLLKDFLEEEVGERPLHDGVHLKIKHLCLRRGEKFGGEKMGWGEKIGVKKTVVKKVE